jgi:CheY-like chemotaxis protein
LVAGFREAVPMLSTPMLPAPYTLLIADDDQSARETLRDCLEPVGFRTFLACDGAEAVDILRAHREIHLALMDMHMPRLSGLEALELAREVKHGLPMILLTADRNDELMRRALSAHVFSVVAKPINKNVLVYVVSRAIQKFYPLVGRHEA